MPLAKKGYKGFKIDNEEHARKVEVREDIDEIVADQRLLGDLLFVLVKKAEAKK